MPVSPSEGNGTTSASFCSQRDRLPPVVGSIVNVEVGTYAHFRVLRMSWVIHRARPVSSRNTSIWRKAHPEPLATLRAARPVTPRIAGELSIAT
jgi:hypothetical protein